MESFLTSDLRLIRETCIRMMRWYKDNMDTPQPPSRVAITTMKAERVKIYRHVPPIGQSITVGVNPFLVENSTPEDEETAWTVRRIHLSQSGGPSEIRAEHPPPVVV